MAHSSTADVAVMKEETNSRRKWLLLLLLLLLGLAIFLFFHLRSDPSAFIAGDFLPDGRHADDMMRIAQVQADESNFRMQVNTRIEFDTPTSVGDIGIINPPQNTFPIAVDFILDETGEYIFASGAIHPNQFISQASLDTELPIGVHPATAIFNVFDPDTHEHVWTGHVNLTILIGQ